jgi:arylmalonate decarboxylase
MPMQKDITIGLVVPYSTDDVPAEGPIMYPGIRFIPRGVGVKLLTHAGYEVAMARVLPAAEDLARQGVAAIMVIGTSLTFYRGADFNAELIEKIRAATGLPVSTMSTAVVDGLRAVGAQRLAVSTAYNDEVNGYLRDFLTDSGFDVLALEGFGFNGFADPHVVTEDAIIALSNKVCDEAPEADGLLISCGGLRTLGVAKPLEERRAIPVVSSMPVGFWAAMRLVGQSGHVSGYGRLFEQSKTAPAH